MIMISYSYRFNSVKNLMNLRDLNYLVALIDHCHFGKAAKACFISQPGLSMQIKKLENTLGIKLIERTNKSFLVTETGKVIAEHARSVLKQIKTMQDFAKLANDPFSGEVNIGIIPTLAPYLLPHIISGLAKKFPKLTIYLIEEKTPDLINLLKQGKIEGAIVALPINEDEFCALPLFEENFMLAVSKKNPLSKKKAITEADLSTKALLLLEEGHCLRNQTLSVCQKMKAQEINHFKATSLETLRHMVAANVGMTLMPTLSILKNDGITYLPFTNPKPSRTIGFVWRAMSVKKILVEKIICEIRELLKKQKSIKVINTSIPCKKSNKNPQ